NVARRNRRAQCKARARWPVHASTRTSVAPRYLHLMPGLELDLLALLERDMSLETATHFTALAAQYLAYTRERESTVSTGARRTRSPNGSTSRSHSTRSHWRTSSHGCATTCFP